MATRVDAPSYPSPLRDTCRTILVTGATGFTGRHLVRRLVEDGHHVRALVRARGDLAALPNATEVVRGDLRHPDVIERAVHGTDVVFHLAAAFRQARLSDAEYLAVNVHATGALVRAAARAGVRRFVHCSTGGVHGHVAFPPATEDAPLEPGDWYQETKRRGEQVARSLATEGGLALTIARPTGIYGPGDRRILKVFRSVARGRFVMVGAGSVHYHLTHIDDIIDGLLRCAWVQQAEGRTYLLAGPESVSIDELVRRIAEACGARAPRLRIPLGPVRLAATLCEQVCRPLGWEPPLHHRRVDFFVKHRQFDITRARTDLGFVPRVGLDEGLRLTAAWYRDAGWL
jgi:nucleoside-diphosphate-sugar epimerase